MNLSLSNRSSSRLFRQGVSLVILFVFAFQFVIPAPYALAAGRRPVPGLPAPGQALALTASYEPALIKGMTVHPENPLLFDFIVDPGASGLTGPVLNQETLKMVKYFLTSLTIPDDQMWVNLSPYEKDRIVSDTLGQTGMGRDLLAQDYTLKQLTSSMVNPNEALGEQFWTRVRQAAQERFGTSEIPVDTFNKVWIVPRRAAVYENGNSVFVVTRDLQVMLEADYLALQEAAGAAGAPAVSDLKKDLQGAASEIVREIVIPALEKEVNEGATFANLRQVYNAMILAKWYKENLRQTLLGQVYADQAKLKGVETPDPEAAEQIYQQYLTAFKEGVFNFIKEDYDEVQKTVIPRKYFSGGIVSVQEVERIVSSPALDAKQRAELPEGNEIRDYTFSLADVGPQSSSSPLRLDQSAQNPQGFLREVYTGDDPELAEALQKIRARRVITADLVMEMLLRDLTYFNADGTMVNDAEIGTGAGGMGYLSAEINRRALQYLIDTEGNPEGDSGLVSYIPRYQYLLITGSYEYTADEFQYSLENIQRLFNKMGMGITPDLLKDIHQAIDVLNRSEVPLLKIFEAAQKEPLPEYLQNQLPQNLATMTRAEMKKFAVTPQGLRLKREGLRHLYPEETPLYFDLNARRYRRIDWSKVSGVKPLMKKDGEGGKSFRYRMSFKGNNVAPEKAEIGELYDVDLYYVIQNGNLIILYDVPDQDIFHSLYDKRDDDHRWVQYGFKARAFVEAIKASGTAPKVIRLNEGHMAFVYPAIRADIEYHRQHGTRSVFEGCTIEYTTHTPEWAGIPTHYDIDRLRRLVGPGLLPDYMLTKGQDGKMYFNALLAVAQNILRPDNPIPILINTVSHEHLAVTLQLLLKSLMPEIAEYVVAIPNASDAELWWSDDLRAAVAKHGLSGITGEMLLEIMEKNKRNVNNELRRLYGENVPTFDEELLKTRALIAFARRFVEYKEAGLLLRLIPWITGDKHKKYPRPVGLEFEDLMSLSTEEILARLADMPWVEGPGLEMLALIGGKAQGEPTGDEWSAAFKKLNDDKDLKGRVVVIDDTGVEFMKLISTAATLGYNVPDPTREAAGTSQNRQQLNGIILLMALGAGFTPQAIHMLNAFFLNAFPEKSLAQLIADFDPWGGRIGDARVEYRKRIQVLVRQYLTLANKIYREDKGRFAEMMLRAFRMAYDTSDTRRMLKEYNILLTSLANGTMVKAETPEQAAQYSYKVLSEEVRAALFHRSIEEKVLLALGGKSLEDINGKIESLMQEDQWLTPEQKRAIAQFLKSQGAKARGFAELREQVRSGLDSMGIPAEEREQIVANISDRDRIQALAGLELPFPDGEGPEIASLRDVPVWTGARVLIEQGVAPNMNVAYKIMMALQRVFDEAPETNSYAALKQALAQQLRQPGFIERREAWYKRALLGRIDRWYPEVREQGASLEFLREKIQEVWAPMDGMVLGEKWMDDLLKRDEDGFKEFLAEQGVEERGADSYYLPENVQAAASPIQQKEGEEVDQTQNVGGIDLNPRLLDMQISRDADGVPLALPEQPISTMQIEGFLPVIINVAPVTNLPLLLGEAATPAPSPAGAQVQIGAL